MVAYAYPLLGIFSSMLIFTGSVVMVFVIIWYFIDNFRRRDHHGRAKPEWTVAIPFFPLIGAFIDTVARPAQVDEWCEPTAG